MRALIAQIRSVRLTRYFAWSLGLMTSVACSSDQVAGGLTRLSVVRIARGMSEGEVRATLGPPLTRYAEDRSGPEHLTLLYATSGGWLPMGTKRDMSLPPGLACFVILEAGTLTKAVIIDGEGERICVCQMTECPAEWANKCLESIPE